MKMCVSVQPILALEKCMLNDDNDAFFKNYFKVSVVKCTLFNGCNIVRVFQFNLN